MTYKTPEILRRHPKVLLSRRSKLLSNQHLRKLVHPPPQSTVKVGRSGFHSASGTSEKALYNHYRYVIRTLGIHYKISFLCG
jgi:hypothetical protein